MPRKLPQIPALNHEKNVLIIHNGDRPFQPQTDEPDLKKKKKRT
jgi:hypothetical protein